MATVAQMHDIHPLLRHPRPITRDSAKAQRMLGLIADSEEKITGLHRERSKTTKWLERPLYAHLDVSDVESEREDDLKYASKDDIRRYKQVDLEKDADLLVQRTNIGRPTSSSSKDAVTVHAAIEPETELKPDFNKRRPQPLTSLRPISYNSQHLLSPEWTSSPTTMSPQTLRRRPICKFNIILAYISPSTRKHCLPKPFYRLPAPPSALHLSGQFNGRTLQPSIPDMQRSSFSSSTSSDSIPRFVHPQTWPQPQLQQSRPVSYQPPASGVQHGSAVSLGSPQFNERRPRPTSFATYQHRDRRNSKIASSRGLRSDSYPNFSRPIQDVALKAVPGEHIEGHTIHNSFSDDKVGPLSPNSPVQTGVVDIDCGHTKSKDEKKPKNRWSTIPQTLKKFTTRRSSTAAQEPRPDMSMDSMRHVQLTEQILTSHTSIGSNTSTLDVNLLPTPTYSPLEFKHTTLQDGLPAPFAPWADGPPSPAMSSRKQRRGSDASLSSMRKRLSQMSIENFKYKRPESNHSRQSSFGMPSSPRSHILSPNVATEAPISARPMSRKGTPSLERTCIICKTSKEPAVFVNRRITGNCWHEPATCFPCLQAHVEKCVIKNGWEHCSCPECGEVMTYDDIGAFADDDKLVKWQD
ncbi:hypothetical protein DE146DRAFT_761565 [Phaeosphaeria sp. MPI-PUGE-AT-0046c]|nr:hypothetical protein DE146DRAFT_761565 [Phaeosphaeria sp. MPI-PUGE-AT-0046c]